MTYYFGKLIFNLNIKNFNKEQKILIGFGLLKE